MTGSLKVCWYFYRIENHFELVQNTCALLSVLYTTTPQRVFAFVQWIRFQGHNLQRGAGLPHRCEKTLLSKTAWNSQITQTINYQLPTQALVGLHIPSWPAIAPLEKCCCPYFSFWQLVKLPSPAITLLHRQLFALFFFFLPTQRVGVSDRRASTVF